MKIIKEKDYILLETPPEFEALKLFSNEKAEFLRIKFEKGGFFRKHISPVDVWIYVIEGKGIAEGEDKKEEIVRGDLIFSPAGNPHKIVNTGGGFLEILIVKIPKSEKPVTFLE